MQRKSPQIDTRGMLFSLLFLAFVFALIFSLNMTRGLNHDEQQFVASGAAFLAGGDTVKVVTAQAANPVAPGTPK